MKKAVFCIIADIIMERLIVIVPFVGVVIAALAIGEYFDEARVARRIKKKRTGKEVLRQIRA